MTDHNLATKNFIANYLIYVYINFLYMMSQNIIYEQQRYIKKYWYYQRRY